MRKKQGFSKLHILSLTIALVSACFIWPVPVLSEPTGGDTLTVGVPADRCPVFYKDTETGGIVGIGADLMRLAAGKAGYTDVVFIPVEEETLKDTSSGRGRKTGSRSAAGCMC